MSAKTGATKKLRLDWDTINNLPIPTPNGDLIDYIVRKINFFETQKSIGSNQSLKLIVRVLNFSAVMSNPLNLSQEVIGNIEEQIAKAKAEADKERLEALQ